MKLLVVLSAVLALSVAAPHDKRSIEHALTYTVPASVSHTITTPVVAEPILETRAVYTSPSATVYTAPAAVYTGASAVSHQSRVDVRTSPAVVASAPAVVATPTVIESAPIVEARAVATPVIYSGPSAVSHQSRYDVHSSPAVLSQQIISPSVVGHQVLAPAVVSARSVWAPSVYAASW